MDLISKAGDVVAVGLVVGGVCLVSLAWGLVVAGLGVGLLNWVWSGDGGSL